MHIQHEHIFGKLFQHVSMDVRLVAVTIIHCPLHEEEDDNDVHINKPVVDVVTVDNLLHFKHPRSKRLSKGSILIVALLKEKVVLHELEMANLPVMRVNAVADKAKRRVCSRGEIMFPRPSLLKWTYLWPWVGINAVTTNQNLSEVVFEQIILYRFRVVTLHSSSFCASLEVTILLGHWHKFII